MINSLLLAAQATVPNTPSYGLNVALVMIATNLLALFAFSRTIEYPRVGAKLPEPIGSLFNNISVPAFIACLAFGHILGVGVVLGLSNAGAL